MTALEERHHPAMADSICLPPALGSGPPPPDFAVPGLEGGAFDLGCRQVFSVFFAEIFCFGKVEPMTRLSAIRNAITGTP
jgi:hypothetical protein